MNDWERGPAELFRTAREELSPSAADRELVRARLSKLGIGAAVVTGAIASSERAEGASRDAEGVPDAGSAMMTKAAGNGASVKSSAMLVAKVLGVAAVGGVLGVVIATRSTGSHVATSASSATLASPAPSLSELVPRIEAMSRDETMAVPSLSVDQLPVVIPAPSTISRRPVHATDVDGPGLRPNDSTIGEGAVEEAALVAEIDAALRADDGARALRLIEEHERRFPRGLLVDEREAARVLVRCASAPDPSVAETFLLAHPRSPLHARIVAACGTGAKPSASPRP